ncbi:autoinducer binding domain-containing protein [Epibacterium ulvae]|uniref:autoinducer binding domain-containing protein n=1 Tax=Epibacterium ulvae TaxID=1156985 RepID=UPI001BFC788A|nr:autoinducer binding domain-containing protein [Epibacterium ulvae]MBT8153151.1 autoinducer binding domain-containing protein [Epibacterium ulvae]
MYSEVFTQLKAELIAFGNEHSSHGFTAGFGFEDNVPADIMSTFSSEWLTEYQQHGYVMHDPVVIWGTQNEGTRTWNQLAQDFAGYTPDVIAVARSRGMMHGTALGLTVNRRKGVIGFTHSAERLPDLEIARLHGIMAAILATFQDPPKIKLTDKGVAYLRKVSEGMTDNQIAESDGVTARAVAALRDRTVRAMGASQLSEAVLKAYRQRVI